MCFSVYLWSDNRAGPALLLMLTVCHLVTLIVAFPSPETISLCGLEVCKHFPFTYAAVKPQLSSSSAGTGSLSFFFYFTTLYWFCHTSIWIRHGCTRVPNPEPASHLPPHTIPLGHPSASAPSILYPVLNLDWRFISNMILYMFQCHSPKSSHPLPVPQSPKDCSIHLSLFCCRVYRAIVTIFLPAILIPSWASSSLAFHI